MGKTSQFLVTEDPVHRHDCGLNQGEPIDDDSSKQKDTFIFLVLVGMNRKLAI